MEAKPFRQLGRLLKTVFPPCRTVNEGAEGAWKRPGDKRCEEGCQDKSLIK
ncbi:rCG48745 [Rattus norvegicus]|uniref:RCG48745 n=1 Tax=Rattus norvegicus TaxID=10116 RepID=A6IFS9_RAT|nr:rCG48745 [Rattus norvegicus]